MSAGTCHELRKFARDSQVCCASFAGGRSLRKQQGPSGGGSQSELQADCGDVSRVQCRAVAAREWRDSHGFAAQWRDSHGFAAQWRDGHGTAVQWRVRHGRVVSWRDDHGIGTPVRLYTTECENWWRQDHRSECKYCANAGAHNSEPEPAGQFIAQYCAVQFSTVRHERRHKCTAKADLNCSSRMRAVVAVVCRECSKPEKMIVQSIAVQYRTTRSDSSAVKS